MCVPLKTIFECSNRIFNLSPGNHTQFINYIDFFLIKNVSGEVVLITGAGGGVGRHIALNFARLNAKVVIWDVNREGK